MENVIDDPNQDPNLVPEPEPPQAPNFSSYLDDVEVVVEDPTTAQLAKPEDVKALENKIAEQQAQIAQLTAQSDAAKAIQLGISALSKDLRQGNPTPVAVSPELIQRPGEDDTTFQKRVDEGLLERGATATVEEIFARKLRPEVQRLLQNNIINSRRFVLVDPNRRPLYDKYKAEIEAAVAALPPEAKLYDPEVYEKTVDRVAALHANEIIDERVQQAVQAELAKLKPTEPVRPAPANPTVHAELGQRPPPVGVKRKLTLTPEQAAYAKSHMISPEVYADYLQRHKGAK